MKLAEAIRLLADAGVDSPAHDAREIFRALGGVNQADLILASCEAEERKVLPALSRRAAREPLQYILGEVGFYRETYRVTPDCLIPRADTELLVDYAVRRLPRGAKFLDLCTGSGCVALSVLHNTEATRATAVDISAAALAVAEENARRLSLADRVEWIRADLLDPDEASRLFAQSERFFASFATPPTSPIRLTQRLRPKSFTSRGRRFRAARTEATSTALWSLSAKASSCRTGFLRLRSDTTKASFSPRSPMKTG